MKTSDEGILFLASHEGLVLSPYRDAAGVWTIGFGHTRMAGPPDPEEIKRLTIEEAVEIFRRDLGRFEQAVSESGVWSQHEFDALVSFTFNLGEGNLHRLLRGRNRQEIADAILLYNKAGGKVNRGLVRRRQEERVLFKRGRYPDNSVVNLYGATKDGRVLWNSVKTLDLRPYLPREDKQERTPTIWDFFLQLSRVFLGWLRRS